MGKVCVAYWEVHGGKCLRVFLFNIMLKSCAIVCGRRITDYYQSIEMDITISNREFTSCLQHWNYVDVSGTRSGAVIINQFCSIDRFHIFKDSKSS